MTRARRAHLALLPVLTFAAAACDASAHEALSDAGAAVGGDRDAATADGPNDGDDAGDEEGPQNGCLDDASRGNAPPRLTFTLEVTSPISGKAAEGLAVYACRRADVDCTSPLAGPFAASADDVVTFTLDDVPAAGFDGFLRFTAPEHMPLALFFPHPVVRDYSNVGSLPLPMQLLGTIGAIGNKADREVDAATTMFVETYLENCQGQKASGLRLAAEPAPSELFFTIDESVALLVDGQPTDERGTAGLVDVPAGVQTIQVIEHDSGRVLHEFEVVARAGTHVHAYVRVAGP